MNGLLYRVVKGYGELQDLRSRLDGQIVGLDFETTALRPYEADLVGIGVALDDGNAWYIPVGHRVLDHNIEVRPSTYRGETHREDGEPYTRTFKVPKELQDSPFADGQIPLQDALEFLTWLCDNAEQIVAHNLKYELMCMRKWLPGIQPSARMDCSYLAHWLVRSEFGVRHGLKAAVQHEFGHTMITYNDVVKGKGNKQIAFSDIEECGEYCCDDAFQCLRLWNKCKYELKDTKIWADYDKIELPILDLLVRMEERGMCIDTNKLDNLTVQTNKKKEEVEKKLDELFGKPVPHSSPKALSSFLYEDQEFSVPPGARNRKTEHLSVSKPQLDHWEKYGTPLEKAFATLRLVWSEIEAIRARYTTSILEKIDDDGRLRGQLNQGGTETGRLSSSNPNLQNIPSRTELGKEVRASFIAPAGYKLIVPDYSQLEPRVATHFSQDQTLVDIYKNDKDIYQTLVELVVAETGITTLSRSDGKVLVLAMNYGMEVPTLARNLGIELDVAQRIYDAFYAACSGFAAWKRSVLLHGSKVGYAETLTRRRRYLPDLRLDGTCSMHSRTSFKCAGCRQDFFRRARAERQLINTIVQGTAGDLVKLAMRNIDRRLKEDNPWDAHMLNQVHDEIVVEAKEEGIEEVAKMLQYEMENVWPKLRVSLKAEPVICERWSDAK
jgi:DNA polymerase-1